jgi:hypothetical protein
MESAVVVASVAVGSAERMMEDWHDCLGVGGEKAADKEIEPAMNRTRSFMFDVVVNGLPLAVYKTE